MLFRSLSNMLPALHTRFHMIVLFLLFVFKHIHYVSITSELLIISELTCVSCLSLRSRALSAISITLITLIPPIRTCFNEDRFLHLQYNGSAYAQQKMGDWQLLEARNLFKNIFMKSKVSISPHDLEIIKEVLFLCVLHS